MKTFILKVDSCLISASSVQVAGMTIQGTNQKQSATNKQSVQKKSENPTAKQSKAKRF